MGHWVRKYGKINEKLKVSALFEQHILKCTIYRIKCKRGFTIRYCNEKMAVKLGYGIF